MEEQKLNINLTPEVAEGTYANLAIIAHSSSEFIVDFIRMMPGIKEANVKSRIILTPEHAKKLLFALQENIMRYEKEFGKIEIPTPQNAPAMPPRTANPFGGGEA